MSLRTRLLGVTVLTLAFGMSVLCLVGNVLLANTIDADQRQQVDARLQAVTASLTVSSAGQVLIRSTPNDSVLDGFAWIVGPGGRLLERPRGAPADLTRRAVAMAAQRTSTTELAPGEILLGSHPLRVGGRRVAGVVASVSVAQLQSLRLKVLIGSILVVVLILTVGVIAVHRALDAALAPVQQMTRDAENWSAHDLGHRFDLGPARDEITGLAATLDHLLARIASSRRHEQRFAAEVAHELRTPLAAIRGTAELNAGTTDLGEARAALDQIDSHSGRIAATLDTLIAFARRELGPAAEGVDLESVIAELGDVTVRRLVDPLPRVEGDLALLRQALAPLIDNAHRHAARTVTVEVAAGHGRATIAVRDDGPGLAPGLGDSVFAPGVRGDAQTGDGAGLGLPLARRLAASCGGLVSIGDGPGGCSCSAFRSSTRTHAARTEHRRGESTETRRVSDQELCTFGQRGSR